MTRTTRAILEEEVGRHLEQSRLPTGWVVDYCGPSIISVELDEGPLPTTVVGEAVFEDEDGDTGWRFVAVLVRAERVRFDFMAPLWRIDYEIRGD